MERRLSMKKISRWFASAAILLSHAMCVVVAYNYGKLVQGMEAGFSVPPSVSLLLGIPFLIGVILCAALALVFWKKGR